MMDWCLQHPWMTFFIIWILIDAIRLMVKYITNYHDIPEDKEKCPHGYEDWDECPDCCH